MGSLSLKVDALNNGWLPLHTAKTPLGTERATAADTATDRRTD